jgi:hypothetical protein
MLQTVNPLYLGSLRINPVYSFFYINTLECFLVLRAQVAV